MPAPSALVAGGGLAGCEAAWQLAQRGVQVQLWEMRPTLMTPAHTSHELAELVCSNSLGSDSCNSASGLLKAELRELDSLLLAVAAATRVPAGQALAVDRGKFATGIGQRLLNHPLVTVVRRELQVVPSDQPVLIATGPLTSDTLAASLAELTGHANLHFCDAVAPIVIAETIDHDHAYWGSRYGIGGDDYLNCPLNEDQYHALRQALLQAKQHPRHGFEGDALFEACLPVEELARRGEDTLRFGPLKPVGLRDPRTGGQAHAVVQLRREDLDGRLLNVVGFQTNLTFGAQSEALRLIPALRTAQFARLGVMHRNTFLRSPELLAPTLECRQRPGLFFAGQITGVEGYTESIATGLAAGINLAARLTDQALTIFPPETVLGSLCAYISSSTSPDFQPMNANWGLLPPLEGKVKRRERPLQRTARSLAALRALLPSLPAPTD